MWTAMSSVCRDVFFAKGGASGGQGSRNKYSRTIAYVGVVFYGLSPERKGGGASCTLRAVRHLPGVGWLIAEQYCFSLSNCVGVACYIRPAEVFERRLSYFRRRDNG